MKRTIITTEDGSKTLYIKYLDETYHSIHGAVQEAEHVFVNNGLKRLKNCEINILELGFGTGLNFLATINEYLKTDKNHIVQYFSIDKYPVIVKEVAELSYFQFFNSKNIKEIFEKIHEIDWGVSTEIVPNFFLTKINCDFFELKNLDLPKINLVYYDCFASKVQPDLWEKPLFEMVSEKMSTEGLLTTYSAKGSVKRILQDLNFLVEKVPGPPGKREMINAWKDKKPSL